LKILSKGVEDENPALKQATDAQVEPTWFTLAKKNVAISHEQNEIKSELKKINQREERIQKLKQRVQNMSTSTMNHLVPDSQSSKMNSKKSQISDSTDVEDDNVLIGDIESDGEEPVEESQAEEMVFLWYSANYAFL
jgi:TolA-binding protein